MLHDWLVPYGSLVSATAQSYKCHVAEEVRQSITSTVNHLLQLHCIATCHLVTTTIKLLHVANFQVVASFAEYCSNVALLSLQIQPATVSWL